jgi:hypothetical protein
MAKQDQMETPALAVEKRKQKAAKKRKKRRAPSVKPLPAPVPVEGTETAARPAAVNLEGIFPPNPAASELPSDLSSNLTEPRPGEELSPESEAILAGIEGGEADDPGGPADVSPERAMLSDMMPVIAFEEADVRAVLEESFEWLAEKFDSGHWKLTERQSRMLGKPTAELLSGLYLRLREFLPDVLLNWCDSTPGLMGVLIAGTIVVAPKVKTQVGLSMQKKRQPRRVTTMPAPSPTPHVGPVGVAGGGQPVQ